MERPSQLVELNEKHILRDAYRRRLIEVVSSLIKRMRWKAFFSCKGVMQTPVMKKQEHAKI